MECLFHFAYTARQPRSFCCTRKFHFPFSHPFDTLFMYASLFVSTQLNHQHTLIHTFKPIAMNEASENTKKWMNEKINTLLIYLPWFDSHSFISSFFRVYIIIVHISLFIMWTKMNIKRVKISSVLHTVKENTNNKKA